MSDYCAGCAFDPKKDCPITPLYWAFLERHRDALDENPRLRMPYASLAKRAPEKRAIDRATYEQVRGTLASGERLSPETLEATRR
jgi:deoxyribodipyrimidine photolyase-related protein